MPQITLTRTTSENPHFRQLTVELDSDLRLRNGDLMDTYDQHNVIDKIDTVVLAYAGNEPVGCGCFKKFDEGSAEVKRMFVRYGFRGMRISGMILRELQAWAKAEGYRYTILETGSRQVEALALYKNAGYMPIARYGPYVDLTDSFCFRSTL